MSVTDELRVLVGERLAQASARAARADLYELSVVLTRLDDAYDEIARRPHLRLVVSE